MHASRRPFFGACGAEGTASSFSLSPTSGIGVGAGSSVRGVVREAPPHASPHDTILACSSALYGDEMVSWCHGDICHIASEKALKVHNCRLPARGGGGSGGGPGPRGRRRGGAAGAAAAAAAAAAARPPASVRDPGAAAGEGLRARRPPPPPDRPRGAGTPGPPPGRGCGRGGRCPPAGGRDPGAAAEDGLRALGSHSSWKRVSSWGNSPREWTRQLMQRWSR
ncbi:unnamed protein product [Closterium sp. Naga37s-1]|nr:unnamed protein product [Closterium sp. Naga37s-1]